MTQGPKNHVLLCKLVLCSVLVCQAERASSTERGQLLRDGSRRGLELPIGLVPELRRRGDPNLQHPGTVCAVWAPNWQGPECPFGKTCARICRMPDVDIWPPSTFNASAFSDRKWQYQIDVVALSSAAPFNRSVEFQNFDAGVTVIQPSSEYLEAYKIRSGCLKGPLVFLTRDWTNLYHLLKEQLLPMYIALAVHGLQDEPFHLALLTLFTHAETLSDDDWYVEHFEFLSGNPVIPLDGARQITERVCSATAIIGADPHLVHHRWDDRSTVYWQEEEFAFDRRAVAGFRDWMYRKYGVQPPPVKHPVLELGDIVVTIVMRPYWIRRSILNYADLAETFSRRGMRVQMYSFGRLTIKEQMEVVANTSMLITVHGAALTWLAFLMPGAVSVEIMPYKFGAGQDFYSGFANWAVLAETTHVVWHNRDDRADFIWSSGQRGDWDFKQHHTFITPAAAEAILHATLEAYTVPIALRNYTNTVFVNAPVTDV